MIQRNNANELASSARWYRRLVLFYPTTFRRSHGELMSQLFRDQYRDAIRADSPWRRLEFWSRILADTGISAGREHFYEMEKKLTMNTLKQTLYQRLPSFGWTFASIFITGLVISVIAATLPHGVYRSTVRMSVQKAGAGTVSRDAYFLQTEFERILSTRVLETVAKDLDLQTKWAHRRGVEGSLTPEETTAMLRKMVRLGQGRGTTLVEVSVVDENRDEAAAIANTLAKSYQQATHSAGTTAQTEIVDLAEPGLLPVRPNKPLVMTTGALGSSVAGLAIGLLFRRAKRLQSFSPARATIEIPP